MSAQSYPTAKSVRGSSFPASAGGFWRRADTRVLFPVEGWPSTRTFFAGIERDEDTELRCLTSLTRDRLRRCSLFLLFGTPKLTTTERAARDADMHLHPFPLHAARRQRTLPRARHAHISFVRVVAADRRTRDARLGSAVRARQAGAVYRSSHNPQLTLPLF
jgi:hypothetical protein